jgi:hypothetical protein
MITAHRGELSAQYDLIGMLVLQFSRRLSFRLQLEVITATELSDDAKASVWAVFEKNMHDMYVKPSNNHLGLRRYRRIFIQLHPLIIWLGPVRKERGTV